MKRKIAVCSREFEQQAQKTVSLAFALCEERLKASKGKLTPELHVLTAAALSLEKVVAVLVAANNLSE